jgi:hypothetical protein
MKTYRGSRGAAPVLCPGVMVFIRYTGGDRAVGYLKKTSMKLVLDT